MILVDLVQVQVQVQVLVDVQSLETVLPDVQFLPSFKMVVHHFLNVKNCNQLIYCKYLIPF